MPNIKFNYLHRDGGNYKNYSFVIFANRDNLNLREIEDRIRTKLIFDKYFYAHEWGVPALFFPFFDPVSDPSWHEFESVEYSDGNPEERLILPRC